MNGRREFLEVLQRGPFFDDCHALPERTASFTDTLSAILVRVFYILLLHRPAGLILNHRLEFFIVFLKAGELQFWCDIRLIEGSQESVYVNLVGIQGFEIILVPPVMRLALGDVARFDMDRCFTHGVVFLFFGCIKTGYGVSGWRPDRRVQGEGHSLPGDPRGGDPLPKLSAEPTTTGAERVVIVGYNRASPASKSATLRTGFASLPSPLL